MSIPEIIFRIKELALKKYEKYFHVDLNPKLGEISISASLLPHSSYPYRENETLKVFDKSFDYAAGFDWHKDISSGKIFPSTFSKELKIKDLTNGNIKYTWEINRMLFLPNICLKYRNTGDIKYLDKFMEITTSWIEQNPYLRGPNWTRNIEVSIRLINWSLCWEILNVAEEIKVNATLKSFIYKKWLPSIYLHCKFTYLNPSFFSSANNHLVAEIAALFISSTIWNFPECKSWNAYSKKLLEREIARQHSDRGINREEAAGYIQFSTDFFFLSFLFADYSGNPFSENYKDYLHGTMSYLAQIMDVKGNLINYGDNDDGRAFTLENEPKFNNSKSLITSGAILFNDPKLKPMGQGFDSKNEILLGTDSKNILDELNDQVPPRQSMFYPEEGHFIFRKEHGPDKEILMHFDAAPLGYLSIAAHGHADALSVILRVDGNPILIDSGTFTYRSSKIWRNYFISTLAHNTIRVDEIDQANSVGPTLWKDHYQCKVLSTESNEQHEQVTACHNGYQKLKVNHQRTVKFYKQDQYFVITDQVEINSGKPHLFEIPWHIAPETKITDKGNNMFLLESPQARAVSIELPEELPIELIYGRVDPPLGWYSDAFEKKNPCHVIFGKLTRDSSFSLQYKITIHH